MNILFISIGMPNMASPSGGFYSDLLKEIIKHGPQVTIMAPSVEDGYSGLREEGEFRVVRVPLRPFVGNISFVKKGLRILVMSCKYKQAYKKHLQYKKFDVVILATPPSTLVDVANMVKERTGAKLYLILRDIHPECLDRKVIPEYVRHRTDVYEECLKPYGINPLIEKFLYLKSQSLYKLADWVGCMSPGNVDYYKKIAPVLPEQKVLVLPNWYKGNELSGNNLEDIRVKYNLKGKFIAIFGGTIGEAQAIWNIATLAKHNLDKKDVVFLVIGRGNKKQVLEKLAQKEGIDNMRFIDFMPREDYEKVLELADVGLISIDEKYKVPTCPSKIIGYMALAKPVVAMFNEGNDYGAYYIDKPGCGLWSVNLDNEKMFDNFDKLYYNKELREKMGVSGYQYYKENFTVEKVSNLLRTQIGLL